MAAFEYIALTAQGKRRQGVLEGDHVRQIRSQLREQGLIPLSVSPVQDRVTPTHQPPISHRRIKAAELALITRQLATLIHSALPVEEALRVIAQQVTQQRLKSLLLALRACVVEGQPLATGLGQFPKIFPELYRATVAAGEQSGHLDKVLQRLADYTDNRYRLQQKILLALFYPLILTTVALFVVIALLTWVVPEVVQVFAHTHQQLPFLTRALIASSVFLKQYGLLILFSLILSGIGWQRYYQRHPAYQQRWHQRVLTIPLISGLIIRLETARFAKTLSILIASSVPLLEALHLAAQVVGNLHLRQRIMTAILQVREGVSLHKALEPVGYFPPMMIHLIASGEASGQLETLLERAAEHQERELETHSALLLGLFEPLLILIMGGIVLTIVLAILLPIFALNQLIH